MGSVGSAGPSGISPVTGNLSTPNTSTTGGAGQSRAAPIAPVPPHSVTLIVPPILAPSITAYQSLLVPPMTEKDAGVIFGP